MAKRLKVAAYLECSSLTCEGVEQVLTAAVEQTWWHKHPSFLSAVCDGDAKLVKQIVDEKTIFGRKKNKLSQHSLTRGLYIALSKGNVDVAEVLIKQRQFLVQVF